MVKILSILTKEKCFEGKIEKALGIILNGMGRAGVNFAAS